MVVVTIELWPHGDETEKRTIGKMIIVNDDSGSLSQGSYNVELLHAGVYYGKPGRWKSASAVKYLRALSPYHLVAACLKACGITSGMQR